MKEEIRSFGSVALARAVVNVGSEAFVATVAVRSVPPIAFHTSVRSDASSSATPDTCGATLGVRPEKVTTASLASTSAPAFFAAAWRIALSFFSSARGVIRPEASGLRTIGGAELLGRHLEGLLSCGDGHRGRDGDVRELGADPGELLLRRPPA